MSYDHHLQPDTTFIMPSAVAASMLVNNTRLSNKSRKRCLRAREVVIISKATIIAGRYSDASVPTDRKLANRYAKLPLKTLLRLVKRCAKLRERLQREYQRTEDAKERAQLNDAAQRVDLQSDIATAEIKRRCP